MKFEYESINKTIQVFVPFSIMLLSVIHRGVSLNISVACTLTNVMRNADNGIAWCVHILW